MNSRSALWVLRTAAKLSLSSNAIAHSKLDLSCFERLLKQESGVKLPEDFGTKLGENQKEVYGN
jgi:hypothetical protein